MDETGQQPTTVGAYLFDLLSTLWREGSDFSSKRPLGGGNWQWLVYHALVKGGYVPGVLDENGYLDQFTAVLAADKIIDNVIRWCFRQLPHRDDTTAPPFPSPPRSIL